MKRLTQQYLPIKGMNRDIGEGLYSNEYIYNLVNAKITHNEDLDLYRITGVKGTTTLMDEFENVMFSGTAIGYCSISNYIVVFSTTKLNINDSGTDFIHRVTINSDLSLNKKILYRGNLGFCKKNLIETLGNYESDDVIKVYWVDRFNKPRFINIVQDSYIINYPEQFSFVPDLELKESYNVVQKNGGGIFHSGTIQYHFTYSNKNGSESNIFASTGISFISHKDRGASKEETCYCSFNISLKNLESNHFNTLNIYATQRSDLNAPATARVVGNFDITGRLKIEVSDNGTGASIDPSLLLYIGGDDIHVNTIDSKDGHLFAGDIELRRKHLESIKNKVDAESKLELPIESKSVHLEWELVDYIKNNDLQFNLSVEAASGDKFYDYEPFSLQYNTLGEDGVIRFFKPGETYRFAIQAQYKNGIWSESIYLGKDYKVDKEIDVQYDFTNKFKNSVIDSTVYKYTVKVPVPKVTISSEMSQELKILGYKKIRLLYVPLDKEDRTIISQGVINGTIANTKDRQSNLPYSFSDYLFRTQPIKDSRFLDDTKSELAIHNSYLFVAELRNFSKYKRYYYHNPRYLNATIISNLSSYDREEKFKFDFSCNYGEVNTEQNWVVVDKEANKNVFVNNNSSSSDFLSNDIWFIDNSIINFWSPEFILDYYDNKSKFSDVASVFKGVTLLDKNYISEDQLDYDTEFKTSTLNTNPNFASVTNIVDIFFHSEKKKTGLTLFGGITDSIIEERLKGNLAGMNMANLQLNYHDFTRVADYNIGGINTFSFTEYSHLWQFIEKHSERISSSDYKHRYRNIYFGRTYYYNQNFSGENLLSMPIKNIEVVPFDSISSIFTLNNKTYKSSVKELALSLVGGGDDNLSGMNINSGILSYENNTHLLFEFNNTGITKDSKITMEHFPDRDTSFIIPLVLDEYSGVNFRNSKFIQLPSTRDYAGYDTIGSKKSGLVSKYLDTFGSVYIRNILQYNNYLPGIHSPKMDYTKKRMDSSHIVDLKREVINQYGGSDSSSLTQNKYIPCSNGVLIGNSGVSIFGMDGDTYYQRFDFIKTQPLSVDIPQTFTEALSYMATSYINLDGRYDKHRYNPDLMAKHRGNFGLYNNAYSQLNNFFQYRVLDYNNLNDDVKSASIIYSKQKYNQELVDKWVNLNLLSSYDLDGKYGKINKVINFKGHILAFQDKGVSSIIFNPRVQISTSDNVPIEVASSRKLEGHRYLLENKGCINKWAITKSSNAIYFLDDFTRSINQFNGESIKDLSLEFGFENWANKFLTHNKEFDIVEFDNFILNFDVINDSLYINSSYKELPLKANMDLKYTDIQSESDLAIDDVYLWDKQNYFQGSLVFNESYGIFEREMNYDKVPYMFNVNNLFVSIKNEGETFSLYRNNSGKPGMYYGEYYPIHLDYYIGDNYTLDKVFDNISFTMEAYEDDNFKSDVTFNSFMASNNYQSSYMELYKGGKPSYQLRKRYNTWSFPVPRQLKSMNRIRGKYVRAKLKFNYPAHDYQFSMDKLFVNYTV